MAIFRTNDLESLSECEILYLRCSYNQPVHVTFDLLERVILLNETPMQVVIAMQLTNVCFAEQQTP